MIHKNVLTVQNLGVSFGGVQAVRHVSFCVSAKETVALIGSNGAGKTTVFHMLTGYTQPDSGKFFLMGKELTHKKPATIAAAGIARTFQNIRVFSCMTVLENVQIALEAARPPGIRTHSTYREEAFLLLHTYGLSAHAHRLAGVLPYGEKRRLEIARALATRPKLLLLDEPAAGQNSEERQQLMLYIKNIAQTIPVLFIEHDMSLIRRLADRIIAMHRGEIIAEGAPDVVLSHPAVVASYLGDAPC